MTFALDTPRMSSVEFRLLRDLIHEHAGLYFREDMQYLLERRLSPRLRMLGLPGYAEYYRFLCFDPQRDAELEAATEALTTNETYFFREPAQLRSFSEEILPVLAAARAEERRLRIWSAGCSSGEEAFTIAILLRSSGLFAGWDTRVLGSDIARRVLAVARAGCYGPHAFRGVEAEAMLRWFRPAGDRWAVDDGIRASVSFAHLNLLDAAAVEQVDLMDCIFCRNVLIYLDLPARRRVLRSLHKRLRPGGYLMLGHSESLLNVTADFEMAHLKGDLAYRKPEGRP
ncbi:MAG TPA: CheR family methyltransferase [Anaeromyxobacteraceae bacterium]|nr:CheR family methyltransferase [Anaeromyxobacteraceae bacterium]